MKISKDFQLVSSWIKKKETVLDLGCGNGELLDYLIQKKNIKGVGIEKNIKYVIECLKLGIDVYHGDIQEGLKIYKKNLFDVAILSKTIQQLDRPDQTIDQIFQIAQKAIITFLNYGYYQNRISFLWQGMKPQNWAFPFNWYDTPEIHPLSIKDFEKFCKKKKIKIVKKTFLKSDWEKESYFLPNLFSGYAIYLISKI